MDRYYEKALGVTANISSRYKTAAENVSTVTAALRSQDSESRALLEEAAEALWNLGVTEGLRDRITAHLAGEEKGERDGRT